MKHIQSQTGSAIASREWKRVLKIRTFKAYGGCKCACKGCKVTKYQFLTLDHIGNAREELGHGKHTGKKNNSTPSRYRGWKLHNKLMKEGFPHKKKLRVLCYNCNCAIGAYGYCPHSK